HTPVPAGHDSFPPELMNQYFGEYSPALGLSNQDFLGLGRRNPADGREPFSLTILALRLSAHRNAVSRLHGQVSRKMWQVLWPGVPEDEVPVTSITNGVHFRSWISHDLDGLYDRYLGPRWQDNPSDESIWWRVEEIPEEELWRTHERRRERLVAFARRRLRAQLERRGALQTEVAEAEEVLDPEALTIGFSRRFATYKRATLLLRDPDRLAAILNNPERPVQIIFAGKAHPRDGAGKELIRQIIHLSREDRFRRRIVFLEDYDMTVARYLVQGADVWLNTPLRPLEASGTSGMKAAANGVLNVSVLDGWWDEAYTPAVGWAIGRGEVYEDEAIQADVESRVLCELMEKEIVPLFYDRGRNRLPRGWIARMKDAMRALCPAFSASRMVREYVEQCYLPAFHRGTALSAEGMARARELAAWKAAVRRAWPEVRVAGVESLNGNEVKVGACVEVRAKVALGELRPDDVAVRLYWGRLDPSGAISAAAVSPMAPADMNGDGICVFTGEAVARTSGRHGLTVHVLPRHADMATPHDMGLIVSAV
ncbi:MAG: alpha-glucan family phosphorylase, partial [Armatimonadetes bacterium]|nr:alpha-glucan family phosphorylase [Armatimonadota bacterium]